MCFFFRYKRGCPALQIRSSICESLDTISTLTAKHTHTARTHIRTHTQHERHRNNVSPPHALFATAAAKAPQELQYTECAVRWLAQCFGSEPSPRPCTLAFWNSVHCRAYIVCFPIQHQFSLMYMSTQTYMHAYSRIYIYTFIYRYAVVCVRASAREQVSIIIIHALTWKVLFTTTTRLFILRAYTPTCSPAS